MRPFLCGFFISISSPIKLPGVQVSDTTEAHSCNMAGATQQKTQFLTKLHTLTARHNH